MSADPARRTDLLGRIAAWLNERRIAAADIAALKTDPAECARIARDIGVNSKALLDLANEGPETVLLLDHMMRLNGVDRDALGVTERGCLRDLEVTCARCGEKRRCAEELAAGTAWRNQADFCPNAQAIDALRR